MRALPSSTAFDYSYPTPTEADMATRLGDLLKTVSDLGESPELDLAAAATTNIGAQNGSRLRITGSGVTITSLGTAYRGAVALRFADANTLQHGSALVLPGARNIDTMAGDVMIFAPGATGGTSDKWVLQRMQRATPPAFYAESSATRTTFGEASTYTEVFDDANNFDPTTGRFTAPVAGLYMFQGSAQSNTGTNNSIVAALRVNASAPSRGTGRFSGPSGTTTVQNGAAFFGAPLRLAKNDYVSVYLTPGSSLACSVDHFSGYLLHADR